MSLGWLKYLGSDPTYLDSMVLSLNLKFSVINGPFTNPIVPLTGPDPEPHPWADIPAHPYPHGGAWWLGLGQSPAAPLPDLLPGWDSGMGPGRETLTCHPQEPPPFLAPSCPQRVLAACSSSWKN